MRIVSLLPSATEMVCALGLRDELIGVSHECDFPKSVRSLPRITKSLIPLDATSVQIDAIVSERSLHQLPLYELDLPQLLTLKPDLIVTQGLCDVCAVDERQVREAAASMPGRPQVIALQPMSLADVFEAMRQVAHAAGIADEGDSVVDSLQRRVKLVEDRANRPSAGPSVVFLEWLDPFFCAGHWNPELIALAGGRELIGKVGVPSRRIDWKILKQANPDMLAIACCGYSAEQAAEDVQRLRSDARWTALSAVRNDQVFIFDGSAYFNRPGPRLVESLEMLAAAINPPLSISETDRAATTPAPRVS